MSKINLPGIKNVFRTSYSCSAGRVLPENACSVYNNYGVRWADEGKDQILGCNGLILNKLGVLQTLYTRVKNMEIPEVQTANPEVSPASSEVSPASSEVSPATSEVSPATSEVSQASSEVSPATSEVSQASSEVSPASSEVSQASSEIAQAIGEKAVPNATNAGIYHPFVCCILLIIKACFEPSINNFKKFKYSLIYNNQSINNLSKSLINPIY